MSRSDPKNDIREKGRYQKLAQGRSESRLFFYICEADWQRSGSRFKRL
jgi:hypothetical protein